MTNQGTRSQSGQKRMQARFYATADGREPVRDWLRVLPPEDRREIGEAIATVEFGWPVGMPVCRPLGQGLFEVRTNLDNRIVRVLFCIQAGEMILLHGFIKKSRKTPKADLDLAKQRMTDLK